MRVGHLQVTRPVYYDRLTSIPTISYESGAVAHAWTTRISYTVPASRSTFIDNVSLFSIAAGIGAGGEADAVVDLYVSALQVARLARASGYFTAIGQLAYVNVTQLGIVQASSELRFATQQSAGVTSATYNLSGKFAEFYV